MRYIEGLCDIISLADLETHEGRWIKNVLVNDEGFIFFIDHKGDLRLFVGEYTDIRCDGCKGPEYGVCIKRDDGYMFRYNRGGTLSETYDHVYCIDDLFPIIEVDGKYNFFDWTKCKPCFPEWFDDVEPYDADVPDYYRRGGHTFTVYVNGKQKKIKYYPFNTPNFIL